MSAKHDDILSKVQPGTSDSFFSNENFQSWLQGRTRNLLCLGPPGTGKTFIAAQVIDYLAKDDGLKKYPLFYFFADLRIEQRHQTPESVLAVLLKQLILQRKSVSDETRSLAETCMRGNQPNEQDLLFCLQHELMGNDRAFVIIDALDELGSQCTVAILTALQQVQQNRPIFLMATSRQSPTASFDKIFSSHATVYIQHTEADMEAFLFNEMSRLPDVVMQRADLQEYITSEVALRSEGV
jgi:Cdc6-like AAA superfamily ATPase